MHAMRYKLDLNTKTAGWLNLLYEDIDKFFNVI